MIIKIVRLVLFTTLILELMIASSLIQLSICGNSLKMRKVQSFMISVMEKQTEQIVKR